MKIETYKDKAGEHRWRCRADNGEIIIPPEGYKNLSDMLDTITEIQHNIGGAEIVQVDG